MENAAIREVEEETGVSGLKITEKLQKTYHVFKRNGVFKLKITYWFKMQTNFTGVTCPQEKEGISKAVWIKPSEIEATLGNSYENIKLLFESEKVV